MNKAANNALAAVWLEREVKQILEADASNKAWSLVDKRKLPASAFLWVEDPTKKSTWHLPYREGAGGIDPKTGMYSRAGAVNLAALRAVSQAVGGARTGEPMKIPAQIKSKIKRLLKEYDIGESKHMKESGQVIQLHESSIAGQFSKVTIDKENRIVPGVALLRASSGNSYFPGSKGTRFSESFLKAVAENANGRKAYLNHASKDELKKHNGVRDIKDVVGYYENGRIEGGIPRADLRYLTVHAPLIESIVEEMADKIGLSIVADGSMAYDKKSQIAEAFNLKKLYSIDIVTDPGSTVNMFESKDPEGEVMESKDITMNMLLERQDLLEAIKESNRKEFEAEAEAGGELEALKKTVATLTASNNTLKQAVDNYEVKEAAAQKAEEIEKELKESKLPEEFVTEVFRESLSNAKDADARKAIIEDRKKLAESSKGKVTGMGDPKGDGDSDISDEELDKRLEMAANGR